MASVTGDRAGGRARVAGGDAGLFAERHGQALRRYFGRRVNPGDVDDLVQEVMLKVQAGTIDADIQHADRYLFTVARNVLISRHRNERSRTGPAFETYARAIETTDRLSPERIAIGRDEYARVQQAIANLPVRARTAFRLHRFEDMTYTQVAEAMGISRETVKDLIHRALSGIAAQLPDPETDDA